MKVVSTLPFVRKIGLLALLALAVPLVVFSQSKIVDKANGHYKLEQYAQAAELYEQAIGELEAKGKSERHLLNLRTKLANCYRMNNRMEKAEALYAEIVQHEKAKSKTYFFYGETLMSIGKYDEAKKWFLSYHKLEPDDERGMLKAEACDKVQLIAPHFEFVDIQEFAHNSDADDNAPVAWQGGIVFSSDRKSGIKLMKEKSGWTGRDYLDVYFSKKQDDGTFAEPKQFSSKLSEVNKNTGNTSFSLDGKEVFFTRNDNVLNKQKTYNLQLFRADNNGDNRWKNVEKLPFCSPNFNYMHPSISPDGKMLFFVTNKSGGQGGTDIWVSIRDGEERWSKPENLGPNVNTSANEGFPFMDARGRLYFCSKGHIGFGGFDIFFTEMTSAGLWKKPVNLGKPINSSLDDISIYVDMDRRSGMFTSSRHGGNDDIFLFKVLDSAPLPEIAGTAQPEEISLSVEPTLEESQTKAIEQEEEALAEEAPLLEEVEEMPPPVEEAQPETVELESPTFEEPAIEPPTEEIPTEVTEKQAPIFEETEKAGMATEEDEPKLAEAENPILEEPITQPPIVEISAEIAAEPVIPTPVEQIEQEATESAPNAETVNSESAPEEISAEIVAQEIAESEETALGNFQSFLENAALGTLQPGKRYRLDGAIFDPQIWQITPKVSKRLDELVDVLRRFPSLQIELSAHTESLGVNESNLRLSQNRADMALEYIVREGIAKERIEAIGCGETMPLNQCKDGVICSMDEHLFNQRLEIKVLSSGMGQ